MRFSKGFLRGGAIAANQAEGAYREDGKGRSRADAAHGGGKRRMAEVPDGAANGAINGGCRTGYPRKHIL
jgi:6-phospho-beta-glucosidase